MSLNDKGEPGDLFLALMVSTVMLARTSRWESVQDRLLGGLLNRVAQQRVIAFGQFWFL